MLHIELMSMKRQQHGIKYFARRPPTPPPDSRPWRWVKSQNSTFSEHGHIAYQIKDNQGVAT